MIPVYTSPRYLQAAGQLGFERLPVVDLLGRIPAGHSLSLNSSAPVGMVLTTDGLAEVLREAAAPGADGPETGEPEPGEPPAPETGVTAGPITSGGS